MAVDHLAGHADAGSLAPAGRAGPRATAATASGPEAGARADKVAVGVDVAVDSGGLRAAGRAVDEREVDLEVEDELVGGITDVDAGGLDLVESELLGLERGGGHGPALERDRGVSHTVANV
jgi:hypothetical protein